MVIVDISEEYETLVMLNLTSDTKAIPELVSSMPFSFVYEIVLFVIEVIGKNPSFSKFSHPITCIPFCNESKTAEIVTVTEAPLVEECGIPFNVTV